MKTIVMRSLVAAMMGWFLPSGLAATNYVVSIGDYWFRPTNITINVGDSVTWSNTSLTAHDTTQQTNLWASPPLGQGQTFTFKFSNTGYYAYFCALHIVSHPEQTGTVSVVTAPDLPPEVAITNPPDTTVFTAPANVNIQATASDSDGSVTNVRFLVGSTTLANVATSPYAATTNGLPAGNYTLSAIASDNNGAKATNSISISVTSSPPLPVTISNLFFDGKNFSFSFATQVGYTYESQFKTPLSASNNWLTFTSSIGNGAVQEVTNSDATNAERYYRVVGY